MEDKLPAAMNARVCLWMASAHVRVSSFMWSLIGHAKISGGRDMGISNETDEGVFIAGSNNEICLLIL